MVSVYQAQLQELGKIVMETPQIHDSKRMINPFRTVIGNSNKGRFLVMHVNEDEVTGLEMYTDSIDPLALPIRDMFAGAILQKAASVMVYRYQQYKPLIPSPNDIHMYHNLKQAGTILGIEVLDYIIANQDGFVSVKESDHV